MCARVPFVLPSASVYHESISIRSIPIVVAVGASHQMTTYQLTVIDHKQQSVVYLSTTYQS